MFQDHLRYAGELRAMNKQASLDELGRMADPPLTKDVDRWTYSSFAGYGR